MTALKQVVKFKTIERKQKRKKKNDFCKNFISILAAKS